MIRRTWLAWLLMLCITMGAACAEGMTIYSDPYSNANTYRRLVDGWCRSLESTEADIAFLGDSLTLGGSWEEYFPDQMIINLGVVGDIIEGMAIRTALVEKVLPSKCFVMGGVNDLSYDENVEKALASYEKLLEKLGQLQEENGVEIYVQSVLPVNDQMSKFGVHNDEIARMNEGIRQLAEQYGMTYIDVYPSMLDGEGHLMKDYTIDGVHLTWQGYVTWQEVLQPYIDE